MKNLLITSAILTSLPAITVAQSDLQKIGNFLQGLQDYQQNQNQQSQNQSRIRSAPMYKSDPNSSGMQNQGNFRDPNNFFGPQGGGMQPGGIQYQNNQQQNGNPNYITYPQGRYPQGTYPQGSNRSGTYNGNRIVYPNQPQRSGGTVYSDPPTAPQRTYSRLPIVVRCAPDAAGICHYELLTGSGKAYPYTIRAGQTQNLTETTDWSIRYRPHSSAPYQTYRLRGGKTYEMRKTSNNWQFFMAP